MAIGIAGIILFFAIWRICFPVSWFIHKLAYAGASGRQATIKALGRLGDPKAVGPLMAVLKDEIWHVRRSAAEALDDLGWRPQTLEEEIAYLAAKMSWKALIEMGPFAVEPLKMALNDESQDIAGSAAEGLETVGKNIADKEVIERYLEIKARTKWAFLTRGVDKVETRFDSVFDSAIKPLVPMGNTLEEAAVALNLIFDRMKLDRKKRLITVHYAQAIALVKNPLKVRRLIEGKLDRKREAGPAEMKVLTELNQSLRQLKVDHQQAKKAGREITVRTLESAIQAKEAQLREMEEKLKRIPVLEVILKEKEQFIEKSKEETTRLEAQLEQSRAEADTLGQQLSQQEPAYNQIESEIRELDEDYQRATQEKRTITARALECVLGEKRKILEEKRPRLDGLRHDLVRVQRQLEGIMVQLQAKQEELQDSPKAYRELQEELDRLVAETRSNLDKSYGPNTEKPGSTPLKFIFPIVFPRISDSLLGEHVLIL